MHTKTNVQVLFRSYGTLTLPGGLRVRKINIGGTAGKFWLDEFPTNLFPTNSIIRHDAVHYGVVLEPEQVE